MRSGFCLILLTVVAGLGILGAAPDCSKFPKIEVDEVCCEVPEATDRGLLEECEKDGRTKKYANGTLACYVTECYMDRAGFIQEDKISLRKLNEYIDTKMHISNTLWEENFKKACDICVKKAYNKNGDEVRAKFQQLLNANTAICDPTHVFVTTCIQAEIVKKCPMAHFKDSQNCRTIQTFLNDCPDYLLTVVDWFV